MKQIGIGDYVIFEYNDTQMTGLVREIVEQEESVSYRIVPNAIGLDYDPVVESSKVKKAYNGKIK
tara:strand:+ start:34 stop:228 length:195 start_codon:yes stop_codon:yes gene_type:complete